VPLPLTTALERMFRLSAFLIAALLSAASEPVSACRTIAPDLLDRSSYSAIFVGDVTAIHLVGYERSLLGEGDFEFQGESYTIIDGSNEVRVTSVPVFVSAGTSQGAVSVRLVGCTTSLPALRERGLFFISKDGESAITVWESAGRQYHEALSALGISPDAF
jgi:hypothetical protein